MKVSRQWLGRYIDLSHLSIERLTEIMTEIGLEVEGYEKVENIKGGLEGIVVGKVLECFDHPNADKLKLTKVDIGQDDHLQIVCGAPNVAKGQTVPVAMAGTTLYDANDEPFLIKEGKIRGERSEGMICSEEELGLSEDHSGIMVLPEDYQVGHPLKEYYEVKEDHIIDVDLTPNRADATHHQGIALDINAYLQTNDIAKGSFIKQSFSEIEAPESEMEITIKVEDESACPRYAGIVLKDLEVRPSPPWLQERLKAIGLRPLNNIVDTTNYILHDIGQPLHAFDYNKIQENSIRVKKLDKKTKFVTLDGITKELTGEELMICDGQSRPLCMAGIYGGKDTGVSDSTHTIFLESAYFDAKTIRKASMYHNLRTDAAKIYEKGADPNKVRIALQMAVEILQEIAGAKVASSVQDTKPQGIKGKEVELPLAKVRQYLGIELSDQKIISILRDLDFEIKKSSESKLDLVVPTNKPDVLRPVDVIEEIIRIYGLAEIPIPEKFSLQVSPSKYRDDFLYRDKIGQTLTGIGLMETMSLSLVPSNWYESEKVEGQLVRINNTSNQHLDALRPDMISCNLSNISYNVKRQNKDLSLFEFGKVYWKGAEGKNREEERLSIAVTGSLTHINWIEPDGKPVDFYTLKGLVEKVFTILDIEGFQITILEDHPYFSYGLKWHRGPRVLAEFGKIRKNWSEKFDLDQDVFIADLRWEACIRAAQKVDRIFENISKYPSVERDLALILDEDKSYDEVRAAIYAAEKKWVKKVELFDVYASDEHLGEGKKSYAVRITFESHEKTMKDKEIDKKIQKIIEHLEKRLNAKLR